MENLPSGCITLEEHATLPALGDEHAYYDEIWKAIPHARRLLRDLHDERLADMDKGHVHCQIISHLTGIANWRDSESCRAANDQLADAIRKVPPSRFAGFATLHMNDPSEAARELERCVKSLGFVGAMIDSHLPDMTHYDDEKYWAVFEVAERLDVPIYIHPSPPSDEVIAQRFKGNYGPAVETIIATGAWGWHENTGLHIVKLYGAGLFKKYPNLKIIIGHAGEMIPMMIDRIDGASWFDESKVGSFKEVWERNIWVTTSGYFKVRTLEMLLKVTPLEHVLYSIDSPFIPSSRGWKFVEELASSEVLSKAELEQFVAGNAKKLFKLKCR